MTSFELGCGRRLNWELMLQYCHDMAWLLFLVSVISTSEAAETLYAGEVLG